MNNAAREERIRDIDLRLEHLDKAFKAKPVIAASVADKQYWADRTEERQLLLTERKRLMST